MAQNGEAISITNEADGKLAVDIEALSSVLLQPKLNGKPVAIISVTGALRTGKSFFLNIMLRYLREEGWKNPGWMGTEDTKADGGFHWKGGSSAITRGILMWNEPFVLRRNDGEEVAVLLMDTQGLSSYDSGGDLNMKLFTLSILASSIHVYNLRSQIEPRDLQVLQVCADLASAITSADDSTEQILAGTTFPQVLLLVRDWVYDTEHRYGFEGGREYLQKVAHQEDSILSTALSCFLMPFPGSRAFKMANSDGKNSELDEEFRDYLKNFAEDVLNPDKIMVKNIAGEPATSKAILKVVSKFSSMLDAGNLPRMMVTSDLTARTYYEELSKKALQKFKELKRGSDGESEEPLSNEELEQQNIEFQKVATRLFAQGVPIGSKEIRMEFALKLEKDFDTTRGELAEYGNLHGNAEKKTAKSEATAQNQGNRDWLEDMDRVKGIRVYETMREVDEAGGQLLLGSCLIKIEDNALSKSREITMEVFNGPGMETDRHGKDKAMLIGPCIRLGPSGTSFSKPVSIDVATCYTPVEGTHVDVEIETKSDSDQWVRFRTAKLNEEGRIFFTVDHFSPYLLSFWPRRLVKKSIAFMPFMTKIPGRDDEREVVWTFCDNTKEARTEVREQMVCFQNYEQKRLAEAFKIRYGQDIRIVMNPTSCNIRPTSREVSSSNLWQSEIGVPKSFRVTEVSSESSLKFVLYLKSPGEDGSGTQLRDGEILLSSNDSDPSATPGGPAVNVIAENINSLALNSQ